MDVIEIQQLKRPRIRPYAFQVKVKVPWNHRVSANKTMLRIVEWLSQEIGSVDSDLWEMRIPGTAFFTIYFTNEEDAATFKMRWL